MCCDFFYRQTDRSRRPRIEAPSQELDNGRESKRALTISGVKKSPNINYTSVMFVPTTTNGVLMKMMKESVRSVNENSKIQD